MTMFCQYSSIFVQQAEWDRPIDQTENASARYSSLTISLTDPGALEIKADAQKAPRNLVIRIVSMLSAIAQGSTKRMNNPSATM